MSSEASENELLDVGPVSGSRSVGASAASNARQKLESALSKLEPPRHRLVPVERIDNVRVERSEKVTVERADLDGGGKSETVRIERVETVYDEESDAVRVERSETVRVERVHTSQFSALPEPEQLSASDAARQMLTDQDSVNSATGPQGVDVNGASRTMRPDRPPPKSPARNAEPSTTNTNHGRPAAATGDSIDVDSYTVGERASERIEIPDRVYDAPTSDNQRPKNADSRLVEEESRPAFFQRFEPTNPPNSRPARNGAENSKAVQGGSGAPKPSALEDSVDGVDGSSFIDDAYSQAPRAEVGGLRPETGPESTGPVDLQEIANFTQQKPPFSPNGSLVAGGAQGPGQPSGNGSGTWSGGNDTGEIARPSPEQIGSQHSGEIRRNGHLGSEQPVPSSADAVGPVDRPAFRPAAPEARQHPPSSPAQTGPDNTKSTGFDPTVSQSQRTFRPPPVLDIPVDIERPPSLEVPAVPAESVSPAPVKEPVDADPFDEYLEDPLGFFAPSIEMDVIPERPKPQANTRSTRMLRSTGSAQQRRVNSSFADDRGDPDLFDDRQEMKADRRPGTARRRKPQGPGGRGKASNPQAKTRQRKQPGPRPRPGATSSGRRGRIHPVGSSSGPQDTQLDEYEDDYRPRKDSGRKGARSIFDRFKYGSVFVVLLGLVVVGLSARFAFSGPDAPDGEILQHQGVSWWSDADSVSRSYIPDECVANLEELGASKRTAEWAALEAIPREDLPCEKIIAPES